jgi:hypothetical protein
METGELRKFRPMKLKKRRIGDIIRSWKFPLELTNLERK